MMEGDVYNFAESELTDFKDALGESNLRRAEKARERYLRAMSDETAAIIDPERRDDLEFSFLELDERFTQERAYKSVSASLDKLTDAVKTGQKPSIRRSMRNYCDSMRQNHGSLSTDMVKELNDRYISIFGEDSN